MMCFTLEIHGWIYHINPRQRLEKKKIKKKENKKRKPPLEWVSHKVQPVSSRVQGEHSLGDGAIMDIKSCFKQYQPFVTLESELGIVLSVGWIWEVLKYHLFKLTQPWNLTYNFPSHLISLVFFSVFFCFSHRKAYRTLGLFWAGSLCANMSVFIVGIVAGEPHLQSAFCLSHDDKL